MTPVVRCRTDISTNRPRVKKKTNIVTESKYTSPPPRNVFHALAVNARSNAALTGTSMPIVRARRLVHALMKNGLPAYAMTGVATSKLTSRK